VGIAVSVAASQSNAVVASVEILVPTTLSTLSTSTLVVTSAGSTITSVSVYSTAVVSSVMSSVQASSLSTYPTQTNAQGVAVYTGSANDVKAPVAGLFGILLALMV